MLFATKDEIEWGVGIDFDSKMINAANRIRSLRKIENLDFYVFDLDREDLTIIEDFLPDDVDIVFLLSVCAWIRRWREVIEYCRDLAPHLLFEANGTDKRLFALEWGAALS